MSLLSSLYVARNALSASQLGLQVTGNNIANATTPDYIRQRMEVEAAAPQQVDGVTVGLGVRVTAIKQQIDTFIEQRLRSASSDVGNQQTQEQTYLRLESLLGELSDTDISTAMTNFFGSLQDVLNQPEDAAVRSLAVQSGKTLASDIVRLDNRTRELREELNGRVAQAANDINGRLEEIAKLNLRIMTTEGSDPSASDAVGLRDQRLAALSGLAKLVDIQVSEQASGAVTVYAGGELVVFDGEHRPVTLGETFDRGLRTYEIRLEKTDSLLKASSGELAGLIASRDEILGGFLDGLDEVARAVAFEFNKIHAGGQGLTGFDQLTSEFAVSDVNSPLDEAGLPFSPTGGAFQILVRNKNTDVTKTTDVFVSLDGLDDDTSLATLTAALDAVEGVTASIASTGELSIKSDSPDSEFAFAEDTSGVLAALGVNTFFSGDSSRNLGVRAELAKDPSKLAVSGGGVGQDTANGVRLAGLLDAPLESQDGASLANMYDQLAGQTAQGASVAKSVTEGFRVFQSTLEGQKLATSGVNLDEEAVRMIAYQRSFQASARMVSTISEMLDVLVNL